MLPIAQGVHHRYGGMAGELFEVGMPEYARDDAVNPQRQVPRQVRHAFAFTQAALGGTQQNGPTTQLPDGDLKSHPGSKRGLLEDQREILPCQCEVVTIPPLRISHGQ